MLRPPGPLVVSYGGGVDSVACLLLLMAMGEPPPAAIVMADPGSEKRGTFDYLQQWTNPRLRKHGWPEVTMVSRQEEAKHRPLQKNRIRRYETLYEQCIRQKDLPSVAYGVRACSQKFKGEPQRWWTARQPWAVAQWQSGAKLVKVIGYDFDELSRVQRAVSSYVKPPPRPPEHRTRNCPVCGPERILPSEGVRCKWPRDYMKWERERFTQWFPVFEARLTRDACEEFIRHHHMPVPPKSSCSFCPNNTLEEWEELRRDEPDEFQAAVAMSRNAADNIDNIDDVGLMRCNKSGFRQLHEWADGRYTNAFEKNPTVECECAT